MTEAAPIILSAGQKRVYDRLYFLTDRGRHPWAAAVRVEGMAWTTMRAAIDTLVALGVLLREEAPRGRSYTIKVFPHRITEGDMRAVCSARWEKKEPWHDTRPLRDTGAFSETMQRLKQPPFEDERLKPMLTRYTKPAPRPDARTL